MSPYVVVLAVVLDGAGDGGEAIKEVVAEGQRRLVAEDLVHPSDELVVVADASERSEVIVSSCCSGRGERVKTQRLRSEGSDPAGGYHVVDERIADDAGAGRISPCSRRVEDRLVDAKSQVAEIAAALLRCGDAELAGVAGADSRALVIHEEERLVVAVINVRDQDRTAQSGAEKVVT